MAKEQVDPDTLGAHLARENSSLARANVRLYNQTRRLENAIRKHMTQECGCPGPAACISNLYKLIPKTPRPTLREARKRDYDKARRTR